MIFLNRFHCHLYHCNNLGTNYLIFQFITNVLSMFTALRVVMLQDEDGILEDI